MRRALLVLALTLTLVACGGAKPDKTSKSAAADSERALLIAPEDLITVQSNALASGPSITGTVQPERRADLRAEISAVVMQVLKENGDRVKRGDLLVRLDDTAIRDSLASAEEATRAANQAFDQAQRQLQRLQTLRGSGMASAQQLEDAEIRRNSAQSDLAAAKTRSAQAAQQLQRTLARAPFDGIVSERKVSAGDTAQVGKELLKVIDPTSMRFEGLVSADRIGDVKVGQSVSFRVNGYGEQEFIGKVMRLNPAANATTRQVEVLVSFAAGKQPGLSGLYAEGRIESGSASALMIAASALVRDGDKAWAWRVLDGKLHKQALVIGERDPRRGGFVVKSGLTAGDKVLRSPSSNLKDGQKAEAAKPLALPAQPATSATPAASSAGS
ncbi:efflux RND transporter periplasmic adaptor subunit [Rhodoferax sp.]|uniref:efflux RND transporter periplasmic adaptor subunit n=1 Tax=Rhodoferax sp. TaxID=50421 RepID=UPI002775E500|nr:efflux RND transporter periplasmic adaptor subunit [Rhodoferax sp.]